MESVVIDDWHAFVAWSEALDGWAFRGHQSADWTLQNSLSRQLRRFCPDEASWRVRESRALRIFRRKAHIYLDARDAIEDDLRCLAMMQHHGAPTRLLDFTKSPFVAAFFALESAASNAAVFALNTPALWNLACALEPRARLRSGPHARSDRPAAAGRVRQVFRRESKPDPVVR
jgi:hypothetical protein